MNVTVPHLPYSMHELEPHISRRTLAAHYGRHHVTCIERTRALVDATALESASLETIVRASDELDKPSLFNVAAEAWNHSFYWSSLHPAGGGDASGPIAEMIEARFGSQSSFRGLFIATATAHLGSGWVWLVWKSGGLEIVVTPNVSTALVGASTPLLALDIWEHAYYLDYQYRREDYVNAFVTHLVNWDFANRNLAAARDRAAVARTRWNAVACASAADIPMRAKGGR